MQLTGWCMTKNEKVITTIYIILLIVFWGISIKSGTDHKTRVKSLTERLERAESDLKQYAEDVSRLTTVNTESQATISRLTTTISRLTTTINSLNTRLAEAETTVSRLTEGIGTAQSELEAGIGELVTITERVERIDRLASLLVETIENLQKLE